MLFLFLISLVFLVGRQLIRLFFADLPAAYRSIFALGLGLLVLYPIGVIQVVVFEGQQDIFQTHIYRELLLLAAVAFLLFALPRFIPLSRSVKMQVRGRRASPHQPLWLIPMVIAGMLLFWRLGVADLASDEREIGYRAYDLVDGIKAARRAYTISFNDHSPLGNYIHHFVMNAIKPGGFYLLRDADLRLGSALLALYSLWITWVLVSTWFSSRVAFLTTLLLSVSPVFLFSGRLAIPQDLATWNVFLLLSLVAFDWWLQEKTPNALLLAGIFSGALALVKLTGLAVVPVYALVWYLRRREFAALSRYLAIVLLTLSPVVLFNAGAYLTTGYVDVPTAILLRSLGVPAETSMVAANIYQGVRLAPLENIGRLLLTLSDLYHPSAFILLLVGASFAILRFRNTRVLLLGCVFMIFTLFFLVTGFRAYYLTYSALLLVPLSTLGLRRLRTPLRFLTILAIWLVSVVYSLSTLHLFRGPHLMTGGEYGRSSEAIPPLSFSRSSSLAIRYWLPSLGWKTLQRFADANLRGEQVIVDLRLGKERARWYLGVDEVRSRLDPSYTPPVRLVFIDAFDCRGELRVLAPYALRYDLCGRTLEPGMTFSSWVDEPTITFFEAKAG